MDQQIFSIMAPEQLTDHDFEIAENRPVILQNAEKRVEPGIKRWMQYLYDKLPQQPDKQMQKHFNGTLPNVL